MPEDIVVPTSFEVVGHIGEKFVVFFSFSFFLFFFFFSSSFSPQIVWLTPVLPLTAHLNLREPQLEYKSIIGQVIMEVRTTFVPFGDT